MLLLFFCRRILLALKGNSTDSLPMLSRQDLCDSEASKLRDMLLYRKAATMKLFVGGKITAQRRIEIFRASMNCSRNIASDSTVLGGFCHRAYFVLLLVLAFQLAGEESRLQAQVSVTGTNNPVIEKNDYIIRFSPKTGSYSLYKREVGRNRLVRLINDREPRSTYIAIALNGRVYTLSRSARYLASKSERLTLLTDGGAVFWKLPQRINIKYYVRILSNSSLTSYIRLNIIVENASAITQSVGLFHMFDVANNNLGLPAFSLPDGDLFRETILENQQVPYYVQTSYNAYFYLDVRGATRPDRVILANWTKLHEAGWNYAFQLNSQGFGYNLYDSNNPALGIYYDARPLSARQSRSYVIYLATDGVPSFSNFNEYNDAQVMKGEEPLDDRPVSAQKNGFPTSQEMPTGTSQQKNNGETDDLLRQLLTEQRRSNELLEQGERVSVVEGKSGQLESAVQNQAENTEPPRVETRYLPDIDIQALYLLYQSEDKRFSQIRSQEKNLALMQELQQSKVQGLLPYQKFRSPLKDLQEWKVQQRRMDGQLDNWNTYLVNIIAQLPEEMHDEVEVVRFHSNLRSLRLAVREISMQWTPLIQRLEETWKDWQNGLVGEPAKRISSSLYQNQQELVSYLNELSDLARYSSGVQQRLKTSLGPLYGELSTTLLAVRQHLTDISMLIKQLHLDFAAYAEQVVSQLDVRVRLQKNLFSNEQSLALSSQELETIASQLQVAFGSIRLLEQWQEDIDLNQSRLAYDPYYKQKEIQELLGQISDKIDKRNFILQDLQKAQISLQSELDQQQIIKISQSTSFTVREASAVAEPQVAGEFPQTTPSKKLRREQVEMQQVLPEILRNALSALYRDWEVPFGSVIDNLSYDFAADHMGKQLVQLINPYPYDSGQSSARNKMSDTVRPPVVEKELYNALKGFPEESSPPLPKRSQQTLDGKSKAINPEASQYVDIGPNPSAIIPITPRLDTVRGGDTGNGESRGIGSGGAQDLQARTPIPPRGSTLGNTSSSQPISPRGSRGLWWEEFDSEARAREAEVGTGEGAVNVTPLKPNYQNQLGLPGGKVRIRSAENTGIGSGGAQDLQARTPIPPRGSTLGNTSSSQPISPRGSRGLWWEEFDSEARAREAEVGTGEGAVNVTPLKPNYQNQLGLPGGKVRIRSAENTGIGPEGGTLLSRSAENTGIGPEGGTLLSRSAENTGIGPEGGTLLSRSAENTGIGPEGGTLLSRSAESTGIGPEGGTLLSRSAENTGIGPEGGTLLSRSAENTGIGPEGGTLLSRSAENTGIGPEGGTLLSRSAENTGIGPEGGTLLSRSAENTGIGPEGRTLLSRSAENTGIGPEGRTLLSRSAENTGIGPEGGTLLSRSAENTGIGPEGRTLLSRSAENTGIGPDGRTLLSRSAENTGIGPEGRTLLSRSAENTGIGPGGGGLLSRSAESTGVEPLEPGVDARVSGSVDRQPHTGSSVANPYQDVKRFIQDVDGYLEKKDFSDQDVDNSEYRWSYLEYKYNIRQ